MCSKWKLLNLNNEHPENGAQNDKKKMKFIDFGCFVRL